MTAFCDMVAWPPPRLGAEHDGVSAAEALSGLEQCLWDIRGKVFGAPVHELLGGHLRDRIRNYANINRSTDAADIVHVHDE
ncbi:MAG: hypothetical protein ACLPX8_16760 [Bryobacteraceae bacterium]